MDRTAQVKRAYAGGAFKALQELGYEKNAAAQFAFKLAEDEVPAQGVGALGGAGLGAVGGAGLGAGGAALASLLLKRNLMPGAVQKGLTRGAQRLVAPMRGTSAGHGASQAVKKFLAKNPEAASAIMGGGAGLGVGALGGGLAGGLSGGQEA